MTAKLVPLDSSPLACYNHRESVFLSQSVWPTIACPTVRGGCGDLPPKIGFWGAVRGAIVVPLDRACNIAVEFVFPPQGVWLL